MIASDEPRDAESVFDVELPAQPYPGLRPFETREWPIFFGRERMADEVVERLQQQRLLVVHGDSGSGKSSLIRAGVLSRLEQEAARGGARWRTCIALPGSQPLWNLARALAGLDGREADEPRVIELRRVLNFGQDAARALAPLLLRDAQDHVCILIDQFEELFAHGRHYGPAEGRLVAEFLIGLHQQRPPGLYAALTMRSEFLGPCAQFQGFAETVNATQYLLPHMAPAELRRAIREPAALYGGAVEAELAERLISDAGGGQDQLPLIQHGLMVLHREASAAGASDSRLSLRQYEQHRGLHALLSHHADEVAARALGALPAGSRPERLVEDLFRAITEINPDGHAVRRPQAFAKLVAVTGATPETLRTVVDHFRAEGVSFLRPYGAAPLGADTEIDISHEALIRCWQVLAEPEDGWLVREFNNGMVWRSLLVQAYSFERDASNILSPATTEERLVWLRRRNPAWCERYGGGWERVVRLIQASAAERERQKREKEAERERALQAEKRDQRFRLLAVWGSLSLVLLFVAGFGWWTAQEQSQRAEDALGKYRAESMALQGQFDEQAKLIGELNVRSQQLAQLNPQIVASERRQDYAVAVQAIQNIVDKGEKDLEQARLEQTTRAIPSAPRVYVHVSDQQQAMVLKSLASELERYPMNPQVPGIQVARFDGQTAELRCFSAADCGRLGPTLLKPLQILVRSPNIRLVDLSARYGSKVPAGQFELWFPPGDIVLSDAAQKN